MSQRPHPPRTPYYHGHNIEDIICIDNTCIKINLMKCDMEYSRLVDKVLSVKGISEHKGMPIIIMMPCRMLVTKRIYLTGLLYLMTLLKRKKNLRVKNAELLFLSIIYREKQLKRLIDVMQSAKEPCTMVLVATNTDHNHYEEVLEDLGCYKTPWPPENTLLDNIIHIYGIKIGKHDSVEDAEKNALTLIAEHLLKHYVT